MEMEKVDENRKKWYENHQINAGSEVINISPYDVYNIIATGTEKPTLAEIMLFIRVCSGAGLNPFLKDAYITKYSKSEPASIVVGKNAFMKRAESCDSYRGFEAGIIVQTADDVKYKQGSLVFKGEELLGAWCRAFREDRQVPFYSEVALSEYIGTKRDGTPNKFWGTKTATMIRKVAIMQCLREAFPQELSGLYVEEELQKDVKEEVEIDITTDIEELGKCITKEQIKAFSESCVKKYSGSVPKELVNAVHQKMKSANEVNNAN